MKLWSSESQSLFSLHPSHQLSMRTAAITVALLALGVVVAMALPPLSETRGITGYLPLHMLLETFAIVIAMLVFAVGWNAYRRGLPGNILLLACAFLGVGMLDFSHMISFPGMPDFVTANSPEKAINFWLSARSLAAIALFILSVTPWRPLASAASRYLLLATVLILTGGLHWLFLFQDDLMPRTFTLGQGLTPFKIYYEYALVALNLATASVLWMRMRKPLPFNAAALFGAVCAMALSEFFFTLYANVIDIYNLLGHIYKTVSYLFLYRAIFVGTIELPYNQLQAAQNQLQATLDAMPDLLFELDLESRYHDYHSPRTDLLAMPAEFFLGKTMHEVMPPEVAEIGMAALREANEVGHSIGKQIELMLPDGKHCFELSVSRKPVVADQLPRFVVLSHDITAIKQVKDALRKSKDLLASIVENAPVRIFWKDRDSRYLGCNIPFAQDAGYANPDELAGKTDFEMGWKNQAELYRTDDNAVMESGNPKLDFEEPSTTPDGRTIWLSTSKVPLRDENNQIIGILGIYQDITGRKQAEVRLTESEERFQTIFKVAPGAMMFSSLPDGKTIEVNDNFSLITGYGREEALGKTTGELGMWADTDARERFLSILQSDGMVKNFEANLRHKSGATRNGLVSGRTLTIHGNKYLIGTFYDITELRQAEAELRKLSLAVEQSPNSIVITDFDANIEYVNDNFVKLTGYSRDEVIGKNPRILQSGKTPETVYKDMWAHLARGEMWRGELSNKRKDGSEYIELTMISPVRQADGRISHYLAIKENITEAKKAEARIERLAHFDQLTGLPNRSLLGERFKYALSLAQRGGEPLAVMFLDLDHFKNINDTLGHTIGDQLLMEVATRIKATLREEDTVSRQGGDEFILILHDTDADGAAYVAAKLIEAVSQPCQVEQHELITTTSIGIAIYPHDGEDFETLSRNADAAMYRVKQGGRNNFRFYTAEMQAHSARTLQLANALRHALARNELSLHYQPQLSIQDGRTSDTLLAEPADCGRRCDAATPAPEGSAPPSRGRIVGAEALLRWTHPEMGMISPAEFIPIAEDSGQIIPIGEWVLRTAAQQLKGWLDNGLPPMVMAVNLSSVQFRQANITELITHILDEVKLPHEYLELELTEAVAMGDPLAAIGVMDKLYERGIRMSIDDFGTGYSSLSYLKKFKVYKLKIDQSFVRDITDDPDDKAIVSAIINMASSLGIQTIAEGVETAGQLAFLRLQGCDEVQGYYFSKPLPAEQFEAFVRKS